MLTEVCVSLLFCRNKWGSNEAGGWFSSGSLLRLAANLDVGTMRVAVAETDGTCTGGENSTMIHHESSSYGTDAAEWRTAYSSGLQPSATVGAVLFPAISGRRGASLRCNFGGNKARPLRFPPPLREGAEQDHVQVLLRCTHIC